MVPIIAKEALKLCKEKPAMIVIVRETSNKLRLMYFVYFW